MCYGTSTFLTFSPERDSPLTLRLARTRDTDPALQQTGSPTCQERSQPPLDENFMELDPQALAQVLPDYDERRAILARDPISCVDGFWARLAASLRRPLVPQLSELCQVGPALHGRVREQCTAMGGVLGRVDAAFGSIERVERQRSGALHTHFQVFLQCLHQFTPLSEIVGLGKEAYLDLVKKYKACGLQRPRQAHRAQQSVNLVGGARCRGNGMARVPELRPYAQSTRLSKGSLALCEMLEPQRWTTELSGETSSKSKR